MGRAGHRVVPLALGRVQVEDCDVERQCSKRSVAYKSLLIAEEYGGVSPAVHDVLPYVACVRVFFNESFLISKMKLRLPVGLEFCIRSQITSTALTHRQITSSTIASFFFFPFLQRLAHFAQLNRSIGDAAQLSVNMRNVRDCTQLLGTRSRPGVDNMKN